MTVDVVVKNCKVVEPWGVLSAGIAIEDGKIVSVAKDPLLPDADQTIDACGAYVLPGVIDQHVHLGNYHNFELDVKDTGSAACGGVTTIGNNPGIGDSVCVESYTPKFKEWIRVFNRDSLVDAMLHVHMISEVHVAEMADYAREFGVTSFKFVMAYKGPEGEQLFGTSAAASDGDLWLGFKGVSELADAGYPARAMIHAENIDIIYKFKPKLMDEGRDDLAAWTDSRPKFVEALDIERSLSIARRLNTPLYIVHVSSDEGVDAVAKALAEGVDVVAETTPMYLTLTKDADVGVLGKVNPALKDKESIARLWQGLRDGTIKCMGTDHNSVTKEQKGDSIWTAAPGYPGIETYLPIMLSEGVNKGRITLEKLVEVCCYNNAKYFGLYPKKGVIGVGSDADLVIVDLKKTVKVSVDKLHWISDFCVHEGWELQGWPTLTMVRGKTVMEDGEIVGQPGLGEYIPRKIVEKTI